MRGFRTHDLPVLPRNTSDLVLMPPRKPASKIAPINSSNTLNESAPDSQSIMQVGLAHVSPSMFTPMGVKQPMRHCADRVLLHQSKCRASRDGRGAHALLISKGLNHFAETGPSDHAIRQGRA